MKGLTQSDADRLLQKYGPNVIAEHKQKSPIVLLIEQIRNPLIYVFIFAGGLSVFLGEYKDSLFIMIVVILNSLLGFWQEYKAQTTLYSLKDRVSKTAKVKRDGNFVVLDVKKLVPGDMVLIEPGLRIPGDGYLIRADDVKVDESILTGESSPVEKNIQLDEHSKKRIYMGTVVLQGIGYAIIEKTGKRTEYGKIAETLTQDIDPETPTKKRLKQIARFVTVFVVAITILTVLLGIYRNGIADGAWEEIVLTAVALGVSTIPEGLIIAFTVTLALGMNRIMSKDAIVKNLPAAETLGRVDVLCIDKTGTLTYGDMKVSSVDVIDRELSYTALAICNNESNFIDIAVMRYLDLQVKEPMISNIRISRKEFFPFSSKYKYSSAYDGEKLYAVGAPEVIMRFSSINHEEKKEWQDKIIRAADEGKKVIAMAYKNTKDQDIKRSDLNDLAFLGIVIISDEVRDTAKKNLSKITNSGIDLKVITGDLKATSLSVLKSVGYDLTSEQYISGKELESLSSQDNFDDVVSSTKLFYRTTPEQKMDIVRSLQRQNQSIAMMGDGVNDSPALKNAEIGISVDNATDVSKEVSDIILINTDFNTILEAIKEGRNIFKNLKKVVVNIFADSLAESMIIILALLVGLPLPLITLQLLWINLIVDGFPSIALSFDKTSSNLLDIKNKPKKHESIFDFRSISAILITSITTNLFYFGLFYFFVNMSDSQEQLQLARTLTFTGVAFSSLLFLFSAKTVDTNIWKENIFNNRFLNLSFFTGIILVLAAIYFPPLQSLLQTVALEPKYLALVAFFSTLDIALVEIIKFILHKTRVRK